MVGQADSVCVNAQFFLDGPVEVSIDLYGERPGDLPVSQGRGQLRIGSGQLMVTVTSDRTLADAVSLPAGQYDYEITGDAPVDRPRIHLSLSSRQAGS